MLVRISFLKIVFRDMHIDNLPQVQPDPQLGFVYVMNRVQKIPLETLALSLLKLFRILTYIHITVGGSESRNEAAPVLVNRNLGNCAWKSLSPYASSAHFFPFTTCSLFSYTLGECTLKSLLSLLNSPTLNHCSVITVFNQRTNSSSYS